MSNIAIIEIREEDIVALKIPFTVIQISPKNRSSELQLLMGERSQMIKDLGKLNEKIAKTWTSNAQKE
jgi:hypothetical protein